MALTRVQSEMAGAGQVLQVVSTTKTDTFSANTGSNSSFTDITGLSVSITPKSATSKILVTFNIGACGTSSTGDLQFKLVRGSTAVGVGTGGTIQTTTAIRTLTAELTNTPSMTYLDSPATTSSTTYKVQGASAYTFAVNARTADGYYNAASTITVMEIAA